LNSFHVNEHKNAALNEKLIEMVRPLDFRLLQKANARHEGRASPSYNASAWQTRLVVEGGLRFANPPY
jgi:hypothetical protein